MSTRGTTKAMINTKVVVNKLRIINTPNHTMWRQFSLLVIQLHKWF
jgi:hypothetical protein